MVLITLTIVWLHYQDPVYTNVDTYGHMSCLWSIYVIIDIFFDCMKLKCVAINNTTPKYILHYCKLGYLGHIICFGYTSTAGT